MLSAALSEAGTLALAVLIVNAILLCLFGAGSRLLPLLMFGTLVAVAFTIRVLSWPLLVARPLLARGR